MAVINYCNDVMKYEHVMLWFYILFKMLVFITAMVQAHNQALHCLSSYLNTIDV